MDPHVHGKNIILIFFTFVSAKASVHAPQVISHDNLPNLTTTWCQGNS